MTAAAPAVLTPAGAAATSPGPAVPLFAAGAWWPGWHRGSVTTAVLTR